MLTTKVRSVPLGTLTAQLTPNLTLVAIRPIAAAAAPHWSADSKLLGGVLSAVSSRTLHAMQLSAGHGTGDAGACTLVLSRPTAAAAAEDLKAIAAVLHGRAAVSVLEPCALLSTPVITDFAAVRGYLNPVSDAIAPFYRTSAPASASASAVGDLRADLQAVAASGSAWAAGSTAASARIASLHTSATGSQLVLAEESADLIITDLQYLITQAQGQQPAAASASASAAASAAANDVKLSDSKAGAAAAAHDDHRVESVKQNTTVLTHSPWWESQCDTLIALYDKETKADTEPLYAYSRACIVERATRLKALKNVSRVFYAMKANGNADVLRAVVSAGVGIECVSQQELAFARALFPQLPGSSFLFTPNFAARSEYEYAYAAGVHVNLDNIYPLQAWPDVFRGREVLVRIDPGEGRGHHAKVVTGGAASKFGVSVDQLALLLPLIAQCDARVVGLHIHAGSGIMEPYLWETNAQFLGDLKAKFPHLRILDLGGGLGVPYRFEADNTPLDPAALDARLSSFRAAHPDIELWLEPGRYLVAEAGVLLTRVTQLKSKGSQKRFVGVNAGMNALIRPSLYGSYHHIVNLSHYAKTRAAAVSAAERDAQMQRVDVVGPICESGDVLGHDRLFPTTTAHGDVVLVSTTGAYGRAMSSEYNLRKPPREVVF